MVCQMFTRTHDEAPPPYPCSMASMLFLMVFSYALMTAIYRVVAMPLWLLFCLSFLVQSLCILSLERDDPPLYLLTL